jgi:hypothetical protein
VSAAKTKLFAPMKGKEDVDAAKLSFFAHQNGHTLLLLSRRIALTIENGIWAWENLIET